MQDTMWAAVFATAPATVILKCGGSSNSFNVNAGVSKLKIPLAAGKMTVQMTRNGQTTINYTPDEFTYVTNPVLCKALAFFRFLSQVTKESFGQIIITLGPDLRVGPTSIFVSRFAC